MPDSSRRCSFELLESRTLLAADLASEPPVLSSGTTGSPTGQISGRVYLSSAANCGGHTEGAALAEVRLQLLNERGSVIEEALTDEQGAYNFADLLPGQYAVRQITAPGLFEGSAVVGTGGGIAMEANLVAEITVEAGEKLADYEFCDHADLLETSIPEDRRIIPHQQESIPFLMMPGTSPQRITLPDWVVFDKPSGEPVVAPTFLEPVPVLRAPEVSEIYGGDTRTLQDAEERKVWEEYLFGEPLQQASVLKFEDSTIEEYDELEAFLAQLEEDSDLPFVDGYTANSMEWLESRDHQELTELVSEQPSSHGNPDQTNPDHSEPEQADARKHPILELARRNQSPPPQ